MSAASRLWLLFLLPGCLEQGEPLASGPVEPGGPAAADLGPAYAPPPVPTHLVVRAFVGGDDMTVRLTAMWDDGRARPFEGWVEVFVRPVEGGRNWTPRYWLEYADPANFTGREPAYFELLGDGSWLWPRERFRLEASARTWDGHRLLGNYTAHA